MVTVLTLDFKGIVLASVIGILIFFLGQNYGSLFLADILIFLLLSAIVTWEGKLKKEGIGMYQKARGWKNVISNGFMPLIISLIYFIIRPNSLIPADFIAAIYISSVAAVTADKFSSEIGILDGEPTMLVTMRHVKKGMSGGVTPLGLTASAFGSFLIGISVLSIGGSLGTLAIIVFSGFFGSIVDSILGYWEEKGIGDKYTSNFLCSVAGATMCLLLLVH